MCLIHIKHHGNYFLLYFNSSVPISLLVFWSTSISPGLRGEPLPSPSPASLVLGASSRSNSCMNSNIHMIHLHYISVLYCTLTQTPAPSGLPLLLTSRHRPQQQPVLSATLASRTIDSLPFQILSKYTTFK